MTTRSMKDLFVVRKGGGVTPLAPGSRYIMRRDGALQEVPDTDANTFDQAAEDPDALLMLGDRGDLRQLEVLTRNMSVLFNKMVDINELYDVTPVTLSPQFAAGQSYDCGGIAFCTEARVKSAGTGPVSFALYGSNDNTNWEVLEPMKTVTLTTANAFLSVPIRPDMPKFRCFKLIQHPAGVPAAGTNAAAITGVVLYLREKAVSKFFPVSESGKLEALAAQQYDMSAYIEGKPRAGQKLLVLVVPMTLSIRANFDGFVAAAGTNPTAPYVVQVLHNEVPIGMLTISTAGAVSLSTLVKRPLAPGDRIALVAPEVADTTLSDLSLTMSFERSN